MSVRFLLLRHAEPAVPGIFHGAESDVGISERGQRQAEAVAAVVAKEKPDRLISSGMARAKATAEPIARFTGLSLEVEPDLHERAVGDLTGKPTQNCDGVWPDTLNRWLAGEPDYTPEGAESFEDVRRRVVPVLERLTSTAEGQTLVVVVHGVVIRVLMLSLLPGYSVKNWPDVGGVKNCSITELICDAGQWRAERIAEQPPTVAEL